MEKMTVKQLIAILSELDQDAIVVLAKDPEGNHFSPISSDSDWSCSIGGYMSDSFEPGTPEETGGARAVCLWPIV